MESNETVTVNVIALKSFSNGTISMFKGEIREMDSDTAETLIDNGLVAEYVPDVPEVGANDKDKYLHTNAETGAKEWSNVPSELPTVTSEDAGKVLGVNDSGVWVAANPSSGGGVLVVTATTEGNTTTLDKTWHEIASADFAVIKYSDGRTTTVGRTYINELEGIFVVAESITNIDYITNSENGYPSHTGK